MYVRKKVPFNFRGQHIGVYEELICTKCGDAVTEGPVVAEMEKELKKRGLWGLRRKAALAVHQHI